MTLDSRATERARDRLQAVGAMAELVVHQSRNRLATLRAALELLEAGMEENLSAEYRATLLRELDAFIGEFNFAADVMRTETGPAAEVSVGELVDEAAAAFRRQGARGEVSLECHYDHGRDRILTDRRLLRLALLNLLRHAADARPGFPAAQLRLATADGGEWLEIEVLGSRPVTGRRGEDGNAGLAWTLCQDAMVLLGGTVTAPSVASPTFRLKLRSAE